MKREDESYLSPFDQNLLIPLNLSGLRQIVIKLVARLLTEGLLVESSPGSQVNFMAREVRRLCSFWRVGSTSGAVLNGNLHLYPSKK
jgi:hypothetical protein